MLKVKPSIVAPTQRPASGSSLAGRPQFAEQADKEGWPAARFLAAMAEHERAERDRRRIERHLAEARLPPGKTLDTFDFDAVPMISKAQVMAVAAGDAWLAKGANLVDSEGEVLDLLVERRRDKAAVEKLLRKLLKKQGYAPTVLVTDNSPPNSRETYGELTPGVRRNGGGSPLTSSPGRSGDGLTKPQHGEPISNLERNCNAKLRLFSCLRRWRSSRRPRSRAGAC